MKLEVLLWGVLPYVAVTILLVGTWWRWRYDQFGWTSRSSQVYESRLLRIGSPIFHFGILVVLAGHVIGLFIPKGWTDGLGLSQEAYHLQAIVLGGIAGLAAVVGIAVLVFRRRTVNPVFAATTRNDKYMYVVLVAVLVAGMATTALSARGHATNYRLTVSPWFRSLFLFHPEVSLMARAGLQYQIHVVLAFALIASWPFTRLVHAFSAPVGYLFRPYIVYRRRSIGSSPSSRSPRRGWERVGR
jgi:nitrate reductase gamma subunit